MHRRESFYSRRTQQDAGLCVVGRTLCDVKAGTALFLDARSASHTFVVPLNSFDRQHGGESEY